MSTKEAEFLQLMCNAMEFKLLYLPQYGKHQLGNPRILITGSVDNPEKNEVDHGK